MKIIEALLRRLEAACQAIAAVLILSIMVIVFADVVLRYLFNHPIPWAYDLINLYLMAGLYFLALSYTYAAHAHIGVDILLQRLPVGGVRVAECIACGVAIPFFALMAGVGAGRAWENWVNGDVVSGPVAWPTWGGPAFMAFGAGLLVARLAFRFVGNVASLATGCDIVEPLELGAHGGAE